MTSQITIGGVQVEINWRQGEGVGEAIHAVDSQELAEGIANGPSDGEEFTIDGQTYKLGSHNYQEDEGTTVCVAEVYKVSDMKGKQQ